MTAVALQSRTSLRLARRSREETLRPAGLALLVVPILLALAGTGAVGADIEAELTARGRAALAAQALPGVDIRLSGRDVRLEVPCGVSVPRARRAVAAVVGVRAVDAVPDRIGQSRGVPRDPGPSAGVARPSGGSSLDWLAGAAAWWLLLSLVTGVAATATVLVRRVPVRAAHRA